VALVFAIASITCLASQLYLSDFYNSCDDDAHLRQRNITKMLNMCAHVMRRDGYDILQIPISNYGETGLRSCLDKCFNFIEEARKNAKNILVHCHAGVNRSATVVVAYLMASQKWDLKTAYSYVKERRKIIELDPKYFQQLLEFETELFGETSATPQLNQSSYWDTAVILWYKTKLRVSRLTNSRTQSMIQ